MALMAKATVASLSALAPPLCYLPLARRGRGRMETRLEEPSGKALQCYSCVSLGQAAVMPVCARNQQLPASAFSPTVPPAFVVVENSV